MLVNVKNLSHALICLLFLSGIATSIYAQFGGGEGTVEDPYLVATAAHLNNVRLFMFAHFIQTADINLDIAPYNTGEGWVPIGYHNQNSFTQFSGSYNGNNHSISNLYINRPDASLQSLFSYPSRAALSNIFLYNVNISGESGVGSLAGFSYDTDFVSCHSNGIITGSTYAGGLAGLCAYDSLITECSFNGTVQGGRYGIGGLFGNIHSYTSLQNCQAAAVVIGITNIGGLIGYAEDNCIIQNSFCTGNVIGVGEYNIGGLIGYCGESELFSCFASGNVIGVVNTSKIGGLVGFNHWSDISDCYAKGSVTGGERVGGLIGENYHALVDCCYSTGFVEGTSLAGGLTGFDEASIVTESYWNMETSGLEISSSGLGRTTDDLTYPYAANTFVGWDFSTTWSDDAAYSVNNGYPYLQISGTGNNDTWTPQPQISLQNYPNPISQSTSFLFKLSGSGRVNLTVYNLKGQKVRTLTNAYYQKGEHKITWSTETDTQALLPNGIYLCRLAGNGFQVTRKLTVLR